MAGSVSGVSVSEDVKACVKGLKSEGKYQYAVFNLKEYFEGAQKKHIWSVKSTGEKIEATKNKKQLPAEEISPYYDQFLKEEFDVCEEPIFAIYDFSGIKGANMNLIGIQWCPDEFPVKMKMLFASSINPLKALATESTKVFETNDKDDILFEKVYKPKSF